MGNEAEKAMVYEDGRQQGKKECGESYQRLLEKNRELISRAEKADPRRRANQVQMLRDRIEVLTAAADDEAKRADDLREKLDKTLVDLEALNAKCTPPPEVAEAAKRLSHNVWAPAMLVGGWVVGLIPLTKRKTRAEAISDELVRLWGESDKGLGAFTAIELGERLATVAGVDPDEEMPE